MHRKGMSPRGRRMLFAGLSLLITSALPAAAKTKTASVLTSKIETVTVTAEKTKENIQNVPIAITAIGSEQFAQMHTSNLEALQGSVPDVQIGHYTNTPHGADFSIRGMGVVDPDPFAGSAVGVVLDGVPQYFNMVQLGDLFNVKRIEILRGPQGTLFGANTTGGVINIITEGPTDSYSATAQVTAGNYSRLDVDAAVNIPLIYGKLDAKLVFSHNGRDGFFKNVYNGQSMGGVNDNSVRGYLKWTPTSKFTANLIVEYDRSRDGSPVVVDGANPGEIFYIPPGTRQSGWSMPMYPTPCPVAGQPCHAPSGQYYSASQNSGPNMSNQDQYAITLNMHWDSPVGHLTSITGYRFFDLHEFTDQDGTPLFFDATDRRTDAWQFSQEIRDVFRPVKYVKLLVGTFAMFDHYRQYQNLLIQFDLPGLSENSLQAEYNWSGSIFAQADISLTKKLTVQLGIRGTYEATGISAGNLYYYDPSGVSNYPAAYYLTPLSTSFMTGGVKSWDNIGARAGLIYRWTDHLMTYATYSRGFKSGGFTGRIAVPTDIGPYGPETVDAYEVGLKSTWFNRRLLTDMALFWNQWDNMQLAETYFRPLNGIVVNSTTILNAANSRTRGVEFQFTAIPIDGLQINGSVAYLDAQYVHFPYVTPTGAIQNLAGKPLENAPPVTSMLGFRYTFPLFTGDASFGMDWRHVGQKYADITDEPGALVQPTNFIDLNTDWTPEDGKWTMSFWVRNLMDKHYIDSVVVLPPLFNLVAYQPPREMGVTLKYNF